jgi:hypothetical protein
MDVPRQQRNVRFRPNISYVSLLRIRERVF